MAARLCSSWKASGQLLEGWKYSSLNQRKAYKQIYQPFAGLRWPS